MLAWLLDPRCPEADKNSYKTAYRCFLPFAPALLLSSLPPFLFYHSIQQSCQLFCASCTLRRWNSLTLSFSLPRGPHIQLQCHILCHLLLFLLLFQAFFSFDFALRGYCSSYRCLQKVCVCTFPILIVTIIDAEYHYDFQFLNIEFLIYFHHSSNRRIQCRKRENSWLDYSVIINDYPFSNPEIFTIFIIKV